MIYFLDDCKTYLGLYKHMFPDSKGFTTSDKLFEALQEEVPEILVCDLVLKGEDGWDVANKVSMFYPEITIIIATSMQSFPQSDYAEMRGFKFWYKKSVISLRTFIDDLEVENGRIR